MKNPGKLLADESGNKYIAYNKEQERAIMQSYKILVHYLTPDFKAVLNDDGKPKKGLKAFDKLTVIGFVD